MNQDRWDRVSSLFWDALEKEPGERDAFLLSNSLSADERAEVMAMLAAHNDSATLRVERRFVSEDGDDVGGLPPGTMIGAFRLRELLGRGGMGEVYRAERADGEFEQVVAIKLLRPDARSSDFVRRFRAERAVLARMAHPNIAAVLDGGSAPDGRPYLVLRFIDGEPITRYAERLPVRDRLRLFTKVAEAVQFAHGHLIVHRDIKPSNILVGSDGEPVLLDFGIAKLLDASTDSPDRTRTGRALLTPSHAAPEQVRGTSATTGTDVYGLGALLFELLTGSRLFGDAGSAGDLQRAILDSPAPLPSSVAKDESVRKALRGDLDRIVLMALRKEPERRYASASDLARDVERHLASRPVLAQPDRWAYRASRFARRNRGPLAVGTAFALGLAVFAVREVTRSQRIAQERDVALREREAGEDALAFVTELFQQSDPRVVPGGDTLRVGAFLDRAEARAASLGSQPDRQMRVYRVLANVRANRGDYAVAESLFSLAHDIGVRHLGVDHVEVTRTERQLGLLQERFRGPGEGRAILERAVQRLQRTESNSPDLATAYTELASAVTDPDSVRTLLDSAVAIRSRLGTVDSIAIASLLNEQARERSMRARFPEAAALGEASLKILQARLPPNHPDLLSVKGDLATWYGGLANYERAIQLSEEILDVVRRQTTAGEQLALANERLAIMKANLPNGPTLAEPGIRETLRIFRQTVAPEHVLITSSMRNLAIVLSYLGREQEGLAMMDTAIARNTTAGHHDAALYLRGQQVPMLIRLGRVDEALRYAEMAAESRPRLPSGSTYYADLTYWLGLANLAAGRTRDAVRHLGAAHEDISDNFVVGHPRTALARCALGVALARDGRPEEARVHLADACPRLDRWGLADPTVVNWARRESERLGIGRPD